MYTKPKTATGATTSSGGGVVYANTQASGRAGYADKAGHAAIADEAKYADKAGRAAIADKAEYADKAGIAENVNIEAEVFQHFLRSDEEDTAEKHITFAEGLSSEAASTFKKLLTLLGGLTLSDGIHGITDEGVATLKKMVSAAFKPGVGGKGFMLGDTYGTTTDSYLEVDRLLVRKTAEFAKLVIRELQSVGGEIVLSPASMKVSNVESIPKGSTSSGYESGAPYEMTRCYFLQKVGDREIVNQFVENDLVRCQTFNIKTGTSESARNRYYWRRVHAVGSDYIDVVNSSGEGTDQPAAGDELVQMGNTTDVARQSVLYLSAYGEDSPSIKLYKGVNDYTLDGKEIFVVSRDEIYALASMFKLKVKDGDTTKETTLAELVLNVDGLTSTVDANKQEVDGQIGKINTTLSQNAESITSLAQKQTNTENKVSKIEQTTDKISLQVETTTNLKNSIVGSALRPWDDITKIAAAHSQKVEITSGGGVGGSNYATFNASGATADTYTGLYFKDVRVSAGKTYVFSVWAKLVSLLDNGAYYSIKRFDGGTEGAVVKSGNIYLSIGGWKLFTATFTVPDGCTKLLLELAVRRNGAIDVCRPMIMEGTEYGGWSLSPYDKTEAGKLESGLKRAGIDLEDDTITATANKFMVKNNSGEVTASVNEKGVLEVGAGLFGGFVKKNLTVITPNNIGQYTIPSAQLGYVVFDFATAGSFVRFEGDFKAVYGDSYPVIILPYNNYSTDTSSNSKPAWQVAPYLDQTFIVINKSNTSIRLIGGGTINKKGSTSLVGSTPANEVNKEQSAILKCTLVPTIASSTSLHQNSFKIVWDGYVFG